MPIVAASTPSLAEQLDGSIPAQLLFQLTGFLAVLLALTILWAVIALLGSVFSRLAPEEAVPPEAAPAPSGPIPPEHLVAITAALHGVIKGPYRIAAIGKEPPVEVEGN